MRVAVVNDIHGNRRAFQAVLEDLRQVAPDLVVHGGDLVAMCKRNGTPVKSTSLSRFAGLTTTNAIGL